MIDDSSLNDAAYDEIANMLGALPGDVKRGLVSTINDAAQKALDDAAVAISSQINMTQAYVRSRLKVSQRATASDPTSIVSARSRGTGLRRFDAKQEFKTGKTKPIVHGGVSVQVKPTGSRKLLPHAFFITLKSGNVHIASRIRGDNSKDGYKVLYGPSVSQAWQSVRDEVGQSKEELLENFLFKLEQYT